MRVTVRYHALLREKTGRDSEPFEIESARPAVSDLLAAFVKKYSSFELLAPALHVAINDEITGRKQPLRENDRIDLMPPFGGG